MKSVTIRKHIVVVSSHVDTLLQDEMPDVKLYIFTNLFDLNSYIERTPLRADKMFLTRDVFEPTVHSNLIKIFEILENPFLKVDSVEYITEADSVELPSVDYLLQDREVTNWLVTKGSLTREFVSGVITGSLRADDTVPTQKSVYRMKRSEFLREELERNRQSAGMQNHYDVEEDELSQVPYENAIPEPLLEVRGACKIVPITGLNLRDRTMTALMFAQYLSFSGKVIIIEKDFEYLTLSDMIVRSGLKVHNIDVEDLMDDPLSILSEIQKSHLRLFTVTSKRKKKYNYNFICTLLYSNLKNDIMYLVKEEELDEVSETSQYITVLPNNIPEILKTCAELPSNYRYGAKFIMIQSSKIDETAINNRDFAKALIRDVLQIGRDIEVPIFNIDSLKGGNLHGLRMYIN